MSRITGRVYITVDGVQLESKMGAKLTNFAGVERKAVVGNAVHGYTEATVVPTVECTIVHTKETSLTALARMVDVTVLFRTDTGKTYMLAGAWLANALDLSDGEGDVPLKFEAKRCEEVA